MSNIICVYDVETLKVFLSEVFDAVVGQQTATSTTMELCDGQNITIIHGMGMPLCSNGGVCVLKHESLAVVAERVTMLGLSVTMVPQQLQCCIVNAPCQIDILVYATRVSSSDICGTLQHFVYSSPAKPHPLPLPSTPFHSSNMFQFAACAVNLDRSIPFLPNSRAPIPFESDNFKGHFIFVIRTKPLDPEYAHFFKNKRRMFVIQVQGRFKRVPVGTLHVGVEACCSFGLLSKSLLRSMLSVMKRQHTSIKYSFGRDASETSYCAVPLFPFVDRLCVTPAGANPPDVKCEVEEEAARRRSRRAGNVALALDTKHTYTFSIKGSNIDFCEWSTCGLYMINPTSLTSLLGGSNAFRMTIFSDDKGKSHNHPNYLLELEVSQQLPLAGHRLTYDGADSESDVEDEVSMADRAAALQCLDDGDEVGTLSFTEDADSERPSSMQQSVDRSSPLGQVCKDKRQVSMSAICRSVLDAGTDIAMDWIVEDLKFCPAAVEINDYRMWRREAYILCIPGFPTRVRSYMQISSVIPLVPDKDIKFPPRTSSREHRRRQLAVSIKRLMSVASQLASAWALFSSLLLSSNELDQTFLNNEMKRTPRLPIKIIKQEITRNLASKNDVSMRGHVCLCTGRRSWVEEWAEVSAKGFSVPQPQCDKLHRIDAIPAFEVLAVEILPVHARPFDGFEFLKICTTRREHTIFVKVLRITVVSLTDIQTEDKAQEWFAALHALVAGNKSDRCDIVAPSFVSPGNFIGSTQRVLNHFTTCFTPDFSVRSLELSCKLLVHAGKIAKLHSSNTLSATDWRCFSKEVSALQCVTWDHETIISLCPFLANVYHTLLLHSFIVNGVPTNGLAWKDMKKSMCYEVGGYELSLEDIDEVILGNYGNRFLIRDMVSPTILYNELQSVAASSEHHFSTLQYHFLRENICDWRMGTILHAGFSHLSGGISSIAICRKESFEYQLHAACTEMLQQHVVISPDLTTVLLPRCIARICQGDGDNNPRIWLKCLAEYITGSKRERLIKLINSQSRMLHVSFTSPSYSFKRIPTVLDIDWTVSNVTHPDTDEHREESTLRAVVNADYAPISTPRQSCDMTTQQPPTVGIPSAWMSKDI